MAASYTIQLTTGTRSWTSQELATLSFQLGSSGATWLKTDSCVVIRLDDKGRLAIVQIDHWQPGNALHTLFDWDYDPSQPFGLRLSLKGLSQWGSLDDALNAQGYSSLAPVAALADVHLLTHFDVLPAGTGKWLAVDQSETLHHHITKRTVKKHYRQTFEDNRLETYILKTVKNYSFQSFAPLEVRLGNCYG